MYKIYWGNSLKTRGGGSNLKVGGTWGRAPSGVQGQSPWSGGQSPLKLKGF